MRADVLRGPSDWVVEEFGAQAAAELWTKIPEALSTAIDREARAHRVTPHGTDRILANPRWPLPYEELVLLLGCLPGARVVNASSSVYPLVVIRRRVIVPWCYGQSARISMADVAVGRSFGRLPRELLRRFGTPWSPSLVEQPLPLDAIDEREVAKTCGAVAVLEPRPEVVIVGYAATADHGLLRTCLGQVKAVENGIPMWNMVDDLPLPPPMIPRPRRMQFP